MLPNSHTPFSTGAGLAVIDGAKMFWSTGANPADSFAIFRVYVSVILSTVSRVAFPLNESNFFVNLSRPVMLTFSFTLSTSQSISTGYGRRFLFYPSRVLRISFRRVGHIRLIPQYPRYRRYVRRVEYRLS